MYSADWRPRFFLNVGYLARPSKKLRKALSRCRRACWVGTEETRVLPAVVQLLFKLGQRGAGVAIVHVFPALAVGVRAQAQAPVVDETRATDRSGPASGAGSQSGSSGRGRRVSVAYASLLFQATQTGNRKEGVECTAAGLLASLIRDHPDRLDLPMYLRLPDAWQDGAICQVTKTGGYLLLYRICRSPSWKG